MDDIIVSNLNELINSKDNDYLLIENSGKASKIKKKTLLNSVTTSLNNKSDINHIHEEYATNDYLNEKITSSLQIQNKLDNYITKNNFELNLNEKSNINHIHENYVTKSYMNSKNNKMYILLDDYITETTCDSAFINAQKIISLSETKSGVIILSPKIYLHTGLIKLNDNISLICLNGYATIKSLDSISSIQLGNNSYIENINFISNSNNTVQDYYSSHIYCNEINNVIIKNCIFNNCNHSSIIIKKTTNFYIENCKIENCKNNAIHILDECSNGLIKNNYINNINNNAIECTSISNINIIYNNIYNLKNNGIFVEKSSNINIKNNYINNIDCSPILNLDSTNISIINNNIKLWCNKTESYGCISVLNCKLNILIDNNIILETSLVSSYKKTCFYINSPEAAIKIYNNFVCDNCVCGEYFNITNSVNPSNNYIRGIIIENNNLCGIISSSNTNSQNIENIDFLIFRNNNMRHLNIHASVHLLFNNINHLLFDGNILISGSKGVVSLNNVLNISNTWNYCKII